jgi:hypothetical protein
MATVKLKPAKSSDEDLKIPSVPINPPVRSPNTEDLKTRAEALVPSTLNLCDIDIPKFERLNAIMVICSRYDWSTAKDSIDANYDQVTSDMAALGWHVINCVSIETAIGEAYDNAVSNKAAVSDYHYSRLRAEANESYSLQMADYSAKLGPKPERVTDTEIKARVSVILSTLGYPKLVNKLKAARDQTNKIIERAEKRITDMKRMIDRSQRYGG